MRRFSALAAGAMALTLAGCVTTQEMPLAPNVVRLDTSARGLLFVGSAPRQTLIRAAEATIARGYSHFLLSDASTSQGSALTGVTFHGAGYGVIATANRAPTASVGVTVTMFGAPVAGAFDARQVLNQPR